MNASYQVFIDGEWFGRIVNAPSRNAAMRLLWPAVHQMRSDRVRLVQYAPGDPASCIQCCLFIGDLKVDFPGFRP